MRRLQRCTPTRTHAAIRSAASTVGQSRRPRASVCRRRRYARWSSGWPNRSSKFGEAFATARVSRAYLARHYLRALDLTIKSDPEPEFVQNEEESEINLEHVMPLSPSKNWDVDSDTSLTAQKLLGNMVLLRASKNVLAGNSSFEDKRKVYAESAYSITSRVAEYKQWTIEEIRAHQAWMAGIAVATWPLTLGK